MSNIIFFYPLFSNNFSYYKVLIAGRYRNLEVGKTNVFLVRLVSSICFYATLTANEIVAWTIPSALNKHRDKPGMVRHRLFLALKSENKGQQSTAMLQSHDRRWTTLKSESLVRRNFGNSASDAPRPCLCRWNLAPRFRHLAKDVTILLNRSVKFQKSQPRSHYENVAFTNHDWQARHTFILIISIRWNY